MKVTEHAHAAEIAALHARDRAFRRLNVVVQEIKVFGGTQATDRRCKVAIVRYQQTQRSHHAAQVRHSYWYRAHLRARRRLA